MNYTNANVQVKTILEGKNPKKIDGIAYRDNEGEVIKNSARDYIENPSDIPIPAYDLLDIERYFKSPKRTSQSPVYISKRLLPILTSRGCPFKCIFCHDTLGKTFRSRTPEDIIEEIVGEIVDEIDAPQKEFKVNSQGKIIAEGNQNIKDLYSKYAQ